jgi:proline dehydrogenase
MLLTDIAARSYTAGPSPSHALRVSAELAQRGIASVVGYWNESHENPGLVHDACIRILEGLPCRNNASSEDYLSVKLPALAFNDHLLDDILSKAWIRSLSVHFDALARSEATSIRAAVERMMRRYPARSLGLTIPGRWKRSLSDAAWAASAGVRVRVVKGEWPDPEAPEVEMSRGFLNVIDRLCGRAAIVSVATHDVALATGAARRLGESGTPFEFEVLYGRPFNGIMSVARTLNVPVRIYVPCGRAWLPYRLKTIPRSPEISGWFVRDLAKGMSSLFFR